jgi:cation:H+ antiporter
MVVRWNVDGAVNLGSSLGVSQTLVGLTVVAVGTSLPELATSAVGAYEKNVEITVGNVVGSNILNIFFILGVSSVIKTLPFQMKQNIDISVMVFANLYTICNWVQWKKETG